MDKAKARVLVSILKDSSLYQTISHEEKNSLLSRLEEDQSSLFIAQEYEFEGEKESLLADSWKMGQRRF
jgi:hypothetical protein